MSLLATTALALAGTAGALSTLRLDTSSGEVFGMINGTTPGVAQFMGIPFAEPPVGSLRFLPPQPKSRENETIDATYTRPNCPQYPINFEDSPNVYTYQEMWLQPQGPWSEDCLTLNVYTPYNDSEVAVAANSTAAEKLPVLVWIFGGGFYSGGMETLAFNPSNWVQRSQEHIVVMINYRNNIFGFPNARFLADNGTNVNMGLLDQRAALEWIRDNIGVFGGDSERIVIWGQSSGSASTDFYNYAYPDDPIVAGLIQHSGSVFATGVSVDDTQQNFTFVAEALGCADLTAEDEFACMQSNVSAGAIIDFYWKYNMNHSTYQLKWTTITDNVTKWDNYTARAEAGNYTMVPAISGNNGNEEASLITWPGVDGPNMTLIHDETRTGRLCPVTYLSNLRYETGSKTFRYWNNASFPNISPLWWEGAYHTSELGLLFGTYTEYGVGPATDYEHQVADAWQDLYLNFLKDPSGDGLIAAGWPAWSPNGTQAVMVFGQDEVVKQVWNATWFQTQCEGVHLTTGTDVIM